MEDRSLADPEYVGRGSMVRLDTFITLVDGSVLLEYFGSDKTIADRRTLVRNPDPQAAGAPAGTETGSENRKITDLLLEQIECADHILLNKCDLLTDPGTQVPFLKHLLQQVNPSAQIHTCVRGKLVRFSSSNGTVSTTMIPALTDALNIVGSMNGLGAAAVGILEEHKLSVKNADLEANQHNNAHRHTHDHAHDHDHLDCHLEQRGHWEDPSNVPLHPHSDSQNVRSEKTHIHHHDHEECHLQHKGHCDHPSHAHPHQGVGNLHSHEHTQGHDCSTHSHSGGEHQHSHHSKESETTAQTRFGITSVVYRRRRPFHPRRLTKFLNRLGKMSVSDLTTITTSIQGSATHSEVSSGMDAARQIEDLSEPEGRRFGKTIIRSKGFLWLACSSRAAYYLSHAGHFVDMTVLGRWWADIPETDWPQQRELYEDIKSDFYISDGSKSLEGGLETKTTQAALEAHSDLIGDRRQEVVFIGQFSRSHDSAQRDNDENPTRNCCSASELERMLDECLLNDTEMAEYVRVCRSGGSDKALQAAFN
jgi:G3E family GTPase